MFCLVVYPALASNLHIDIIIIIFYKQNKNLPNLKACSTFPQTSRTSTLFGIYLIEKKNTILDVT